MANIRKRSAVQMINEEGGAPTTGAAVIGPDAKWGYTHVRLPSGKEGRIPTENVDKFIAHYKPREVGARSLGEQSESLLKGAERGSSLEFSDELKGLDAARGALRAKPGFKSGMVSGLIEAIPTDTLSGLAARAVDDDAASAYTNARDMERREQQRLAARAPGATMAGSIVGGAPTMAIPGVAPAVATGVASGLGSAKETKDLASSGAKGAILPALFGVASKGLARVFPQRAAAKAAKAVDEIVPENVSAMGDDFAAKARLARTKQARAGLEGIDDVGKEIDELRHSEEIAKKSQAIADERARILTDAPIVPKRRPVSEIADEIAMEDALASLPGVKAPKPMRTGAARPSAKRAEAGTPDVDVMAGPGAKIEALDPVTASPAALSRPSWWTDEWFPSSLTTDKGAALLRRRASAEIDRLPEAQRGAAKNDIERMIGAALGKTPEKTKVYPELAATSVKKVADEAPQPAPKAEPAPEEGTRVLDEKAKNALARYLAQADEAGSDAAAAGERASALEGFRKRLDAVRGIDVEGEAARAAGRYAASEAKMGPALERAAKMGRRVEAYDKYAPTVARVAARGGAGALGASAFGGAGVIGGIGAAGLWSLSNHPKVAAKLAARVANRVEAGAEGAARLSQGVVPSFEASMRDPSFVEKAMRELERDPQLRAEVEKAIAQDSGGDHGRRLPALRERRASVARLLSSP